MPLQTYATSEKERGSYYSYFIGQNIIYFVITMFLSVYYTSSLGISTTVVATILLAARIWDAVNDPLLSLLVEKSHLKGGKFLPWIKAVAFLVPLATVLNFSFTNELIASPMHVRIIYAAVTYVLWGMIYTISDAPAFALATVMTPDLNERNTIISFSKMFAIIGVAIGMIGFSAVLSLTDSFAEKYNYFITALIFAIFALVFMLQIYHVRERVRSEVKTPRLSLILMTIIKNKYLIVFVLTYILLNGLNFISTLIPFVAQDIYNKTIITSVLSALSLIPSLIIAPLTPKLIRKYGKIALMNFSLASLIITSVLIYFAGYQSLIIFLALSVIRSLTAGFTLIIPALFFADCIEYDYYRKGVRFEAITFATQTFSNKLVAALSGAGAMWFLGLYGYVSSTADETVHQSVQVLNGMWLIYNLGPALGGVLALLVFVPFYHLTEKKLRELKEQSGR